MNLIKHIRRVGYFLVMYKSIPALLLAFTITSCSTPKVDITGKDYQIVNHPCVVIFGDTRTNDDAHRKVVEGIKKVSPVAVFHMGDLVANGKEAKQWLTFDSIEGDMIKATHFYPSMGNHERDSPLYWSHFKLPEPKKWYSVDEMGIHFIVLNSEYDLNHGSHQNQWLLADLQKNEKSKAFKVAVFHYPPFSTGKHPNDEYGLQKSIVPLFQQYGVNMVFNGHQHCYERLQRKGIYYIVTGGGGAPLHKQERKIPESQLYLETYHFCMITVENQTLTMVALTPDLKEIDRVVIKK